MTQPADTAMEVTICAIDVTALWRGAEVLVAFKDDPDAVHEAARAWAQVRGYHRSTRALDEVFTAEPPESGFHLLIHKPHGLLLFARWPWCEQLDPWNRATGQP